MDIFMSNAFVAKVWAAQSATGAESAQDWLQIASLLLFYTMRSLNEKHNKHLHQCLYIYKLWEIVEKDTNYDLMAV